MNDFGRFLRELMEHPQKSRREIAMSLRIPAGKGNTLAQKAVGLGYITEDPLRLTEKGKEYLEGFRVRNAVILASVVDVRFVPFTHEIPKSLMEVEGERIIVRLIKQLHEKGITDITIVVGYMAERFDYLIDDYDVKLIFNQEFTTKSNLAGMYLAKEELGNTYIMYADQWLWRNIFHTYEMESWSSCYWHEGATDRWCVQTNGEQRIRKMKHGGRDVLELMGPTFITDEFASQLKPFIEQAYHAVGTNTFRWETLMKDYFDKLELYANILPVGLVQDFKNFDELREFDTSYAESSGNTNLHRIAQIFDIPEHEITDMAWLEIGMTNQSFLFNLKGERYIYRIPGDGSDAFISRKQEADVYHAIKDLHIADEIVYIDAETGIKISKFFPNSYNLPEDDRANIKKAMGILRKLHDSGVSVPHKFDIEERLKTYDAMCREVDCIHFEDYEKTVERIRLPLKNIAECGVERVLCHIDAVTNNFLILEDGDMKLLDWEYGGMCHALADVAMFGVFSAYSKEQMDELLEWYLNRPAAFHEKKLCYSYAACGGLLWSLWAEFRQHYGEDFGEYAMINYRLSKNFTKILYKMDENPELDLPKERKVKQAEVTKRYRQNKGEKKTKAVKQEKMEVGEG